MASNKLSFILYEDKTAPKYFEISKGIFRFFLLGLPTITLISLTIVGLGTLYFKHIKTLTERKEPQIISELRQREAVLVRQHQELSRLNNSLENKLTHTEVKGGGLPILSLFKATPGQKDLSQTPVLSIEEFNTLVEGKKLTLRFNIIKIANQLPKLTGYIFVVMKNGNTIQFYPSNAMAKDEMILNFNNGESFGIKRGRDVEAKFNLPLTNSEALFKVLIFSRTGDLMHKQIFSKNIVVK